jgi:CRISPR-associated protein Cas5t
MICVHVECPYASFRKSFARSYAETYSLPPPATVYGMLLSLVGERFRRRHVGVRLAFAHSRMPRVATTLRKLSRYKYGVASKQEKLGNAPDYVETLCGIDFLCFVDSVGELSAAPTLEMRVAEAIREPDRVTRCGVVSIGLSDDAVDAIRLVDEGAPPGVWRWMSPADSGRFELPVWVDHVGAKHTRWSRFDFDDVPAPIVGQPARERFTPIIDPRGP